MKGFVGKVRAIILRVGISVAKAIPRIPLGHTIWQRLLRRQTTPGVSCGYHIIKTQDVTPDLIAGWQNPTIPQRQRQLVNSELERMYQGDVIPVYQIAADAVKATKEVAPFIVEVGCASGYYSEVLSYLLGHRVRYLGIDYSAALIKLAQQCYPTVPFLLADATALPLLSGYCDILFSPALLMHVPAYEQAIQECARVSHSWCIFHRTPVVKQAPVTYFSKYAYGVPVVEIAFNEEELLSLFDKYGLEVRDTFTIGQGMVEGLSEAVRMTTYVCRKR